MVFSPDQDPTVKELQLLAWIPFPLSKDPLSKDTISKDPSALSMRVASCSQG